MELVKASKWLLVLGGLMLGYQGLTGVMLVEPMLGETVAKVLNLLIGVAAVYLAYWMLTMKKGEK